MEDSCAAGAVGSLTHLAMLLAELDFSVDLGFGRRDPDADNDPRLDDVELSIQPGATGFELSRRWSPVDYTAFLRFDRPTLDHIGEPQLASFETDLLQGLIEQPARWPSKRPARLLLDDPRPLTDKHHLGMDIAFTENHPKAPVSVRAPWAGKSLST
jgi:hypothetical protein